jgi:hypothetical protein
VQVRAADAAGAEAQQHLPGPDLGHVDRLDPQVVLGVDPAGKHVILLVAIVDRAGGGVRARRCPRHQ